jgi:GGDEF domain-containing protein
MSLLINNVESSDLQIQYSYLDSDEIFGYVLTANYKINISDIQFEIGNGVLLSGRSAIRSAYERQNVTARIGGDEFVNALITNLSFEKSSLVGSETASITIVERRRLNDYSSSTFSKYIPNPHLLESFEENYNFARKDETFSYTRNVSIKYTQDAGDQFLNNAKLFLTNYYHNNRPSLGYYEDGISENAKFDNKFYSKLTEDIDLIQLSVSLQESFESSFIDNANNVSKKTSEKISQNINGYLEKMISIEITSLSFDTQRTIEAAISNIIDEVISGQQSQFGKPHSISKGISSDSNRASIELSFSTDPSLSQQNTVIYSCSKQKNGANYEYSLSTTYSSTGQNLSKRYYNALALWTSQKSQNESKVISLFSEASGLIYEQSRSTTMSKDKAEIAEQIMFSTNEIYNNSGLPDGIIKFEINVNKNNPVRRNERIISLGSSEKLVVSNLGTVESASVTATAIADPSYGMFHAKNFLASKTSEMNDALDEGVYYGTQDQSTIDLSNGVTTRVINYTIT